MDAREAKRARLQGPDSELRLERAQQSSASIVPASAPLAVRDRCAAYPGTLPYRAGTFVSNWIDLDNGGTEPLAFLEFPWLCTLKAACYWTQAAVNRELWHRIRYFEYKPAFLDVARSVSRKGRAHGKNEGTVSKRLARFLSHPKHVRGFEDMNLLKAPISVLEKENVHAALGRMPNLRRVILPWEGWSTPNDRQKFLKILPEGVAFKCCRLDGQTPLRGSVGPADDTTWLHELGRE